MIEKAKIEAGQAPKICVSIAAAQKDEIIKEAALALEVEADMIEWRADAYEEAAIADDLESVLKELRKEADEMPILFTYRTKAEGGSGSTDPGLYAGIAMEAIGSGCIDLIDVEVCSESSASKEIIDYAHERDVEVIASYHNFVETPPADEIAERFDELKKSGADILKVAVMAECEGDLSRLCEAAAETQAKYPELPLVAIAMGEAGVQSRIDAEKFCSSIIFAAGLAETAPGQLNIHDLRKMRSAR